MIHIGLTGWGDHDDLYLPGTKSKDKLAEYSAHFPIVEVDSSFYAVQPADRMAKWAEDTPEHFSFIVKAYQGMTGHLRGKPYFTDTESMYAAFNESLKPMIECGKLKAVLFQFPPWFDCTRDNVNTLREIKERMQGIPCALEFRHQSWFEGDMQAKTLAFMRREGWIHSICDEPDAGQGSIPTILSATDDDLSIIRFHGRNAAGWHQSGAPNWREVRYLYRYNEEELADWKLKLHELSRQSKEICIVFNNNSGGDAAANAKQLMTLLGMSPQPLASDIVKQRQEEEPEQLELF
ncbi:DUF72 domain-containing protein [Paenibacillus gallinarum]|uniref:DUF72 domain-containing protein n=1 Tax=Paenibacillus gallinarum TaxID=2762232 RepID=A0ABR8T3A3_9BACL|nr:DUF72 domain-containing protein [Paenibacillus gallinarum]MBD7969779.1 DUF72 domain-containing protein [Paenibacillus gallinarum]